MKCGYYHDKTDHMILRSLELACGGMRGLKAWIREASTEWAVLLGVWKVGELTEMRAGKMPWGILGKNLSVSNCMRMNLNAPS